MRSVKALTLVRRRRGNRPVATDGTDARDETALPESGVRRPTVLPMTGILQRLPVPTAPHALPHLPRGTQQQRPQNEDRPD